MTPYADDKSSTFAIPRAPSALLDALERAERDYEDAKSATERATQRESDAIANRKLLKRDIINDLRKLGMSDSRSDKEYVDDERWKKNEADVAIAQDAKRSLAVDESIARHRMLTLRAAIVPVTAVLLIRFAKPIDSDTATALVDSSFANASSDDAHSGDANIAATGGATT